jgi:hypothetical protein
MIFRPSHSVHPRPSLDIHGARKSTSGLLDVSFVTASFCHCIWDSFFNVQIFELLTGAALFDPKADPGGKFTADDQHLLRMMQIKEEAIPEDMLLTSIKAGEFFETTGK